MHLETSDRTDGITEVALVGRLDLNGIHAIDLKFHAVTAARKQPTIVDLRALEYIASLGMGLLISCAQSLQRKGYRMVLSGAHSTVDLALRTAGIDQAIPMVADIDAAEHLLANA